MENIWYNVTVFLQVFCYYECDERYKTECLFFVSAAGVPVSAPPDSHESPIGLRSP
jgi:hypothetical protein